MPVLTFPLALLLVTCFVGGSLVTWILQERRHRREQESLEQQMTRALQARYEVYEGLEQTVIKLLTRFESMESEFRTRLAEAHNPRIALDKTVKLRSTNPELWDLEREYHQQRCDHLNEIARQSARIAELMETVQSAEPTRMKLEEELTHTRSRYETAVANATDSEKVYESKLERLQTRVAALEPLESLVEAGRREIEALKAAEASRTSEHASEVAALQARVEELQASSGRIPALEQSLARREEECRTLSKRALELESELTNSRRLAEAAETRCAALSQERESSRGEADELRSTLEVTRTSQSELQKEYDALRSQLSELEERGKNQAATLADALLATDSLREQVATAKKEASEQSVRANALQHELDGVRGEQKSKMNKLEDDLIDARNELQIARSDVEAVRLELAEAKSRAAAQQSQSQQERAKLEQALKGAQTENLLYRAKLTSHSSHVEQAWSVLSELKPMLEALEEKLKVTDEPPALPAQSTNIDLSVLDEKPAHHD